MRVVARWCLAGVASEVVMAARREIVGALENLTPHSVWSLEKKTKQSCALAEFEMRGFNLWHAIVFI
ncbi:hypothetical protein ACFX15_029486 [Malus domestica]